MNECLKYKKKLCIATKLIALSKNHAYTAQKTIDHFEVVLPLDFHKTSQTFKLNFAVWEAYMVI